MLGDIGVTGRLLERLRGATTLFALISMVVAAHAALAPPTPGAGKIVIVVAMVLLASGWLRPWFGRKRTLVEDIVEALAVPAVVLFSRGNIEAVAGIVFASLFVRPLLGPGTFRRVAPVLYCAAILAARFFQDRRCSLAQTLAVLLVGVLMNVLAQAVEEQAHALQEADATRKQLYLSELSRRDAQRLEALGRLAGGIAHDFNNVLACIGSYTEFAREAIAADHPAQEDLAQVRLATERAKELTDGLLSVGRRAPSQASAIDIAAVTADSVATLRRMMPKSIQLTFERDPQLAPIHAERSKIERLLTNLVLNARDACDRGGRIQVELRGVSGGVHLLVRDDGRGMSEETRRRVFEPFFTTKESAGTGLGLANVDAIVRQLGGTISLSSAVGEGTTFRVFLPTGTRRALRANPSRPNLSPASQRRILVVDDEKGVRLAAQRVLESAGHAVHVAGSAAEALETMEAAAKPYHLVLSDIIMPETTGMELGARVAERWPGVAVLYMSGFTGDDDVEELDILPKPFSNAALLDFTERAFAVAA